MLLRASGEAIDEDVELTGAVGDADGDAGVPHGQALVRFAEAATRGSDDLEAARTALLDDIGGAGFIEAAATVGIFNGLVRVADSTGIPLDDGTRDRSDQFREALGLNAFGGSRNTDLGQSPAGSPGAAGPAGDALDLFRQGK
jgi:hypothetical protein